jgi:hypothetical protein
MVGDGACVEHPRQTVAGDVAGGGGKGVSDSRFSRYLGRVVSSLLHVWGKAYGFLGEVAKLLAIPALILSGLSAWYAYQNLSIQKGNTAPRIEITQLDLSPGQKDNPGSFKIEYQNVGGSPAYSLRIDSISVSETKSIYRSFWLTTSNPIERGSSRHGRGEFVSPSNMSNVPYIVCVRFSDRDGNKYTEERLYTTNRDGSAIQDMQPDKTTSIAPPDVCDTQ